MSFQFSDRQKLRKISILLLFVFASCSFFFACASNIKKTYQGPALSEDQISIIATVNRKPDFTNKTKGQKVASFLVAAPDRRYSLFISKIDGINTLESPDAYTQNRPPSYYEVAAGKHNIEFKIQRETTSYLGKTKTDYKILDFEKIIELDCKGGHIYFLDFTPNDNTFKLISKDVSEDPKYKSIMNQR